MISDVKVALIPRVTMESDMGSTLEYAILITDKRSIFVLEKPRRALNSNGIPFPIDYVNIPIERMLSKDTFFIPHEVIQHIRIKKSVFVYQLRIDYINTYGKMRHFECSLDPPSELLKQKTGEGQKAKQVWSDYARKVRRAYDLALPIQAQQRTEWLL